MTRANLNLSPLNVHANVNPNYGTPHSAGSAGQAVAHSAARLMDTPGFSRGTIGLHLNSEQLVQALGGVAQVLNDLNFDGRLIPNPLLSSFEVHADQGHAAGLRVSLSPSGQRRVVESTDISAMRKALSDVAIQFNDLFLQRVQCSPSLIDGLTASRAVSELAPLLESEKGIVSADLRFAQRKMY